MTPYNIATIQTPSSLFRQLRESWKKERNPLTSNVAEMAMCPSYQRIIGMGKPAIPLILKQLHTEAKVYRQPDHWFWALWAISGENPVPAEHAGDTLRMAQAWLRWGKDTGHYTP